VPTIFDALNLPQHLTKDRKRRLSATLFNAKNCVQLEHGYCKKQSLIAPTVAGSSASDYSTFQTELDSANVTQSFADTGSCCEHAGLQEKVTVLQKKVKQLQQQLRLERTRHSSLVLGLKSFLNPDQIRFLRLRSNSKRTLHWSNKTVKSCLQIRYAAGKKGYSHLRNHGFPVPSYRTLCDRVVNAEFRPGIQNDVLEWLKVKMSAGSARFRDCCLALDEMQLRPSLEYDKGIDSTFGPVHTWPD